MLIFGAALAFAFLNVKRAPKRQLSNNRNHLLQAILYKLQQTSQKFLF